MAQTTNKDFNPSGRVDVAAVKEKFLELEELIKANCPEGRRRAVALTNLETAAMYAVKSFFEP